MPHLKTWSDLPPAIRRHLIPPLVHEFCVVGMSRCATPSFASPEALATKTVLRTS